MVAAPETLKRVATLFSGSAVTVSWPDPPIARVGAAMAEVDRSVSEPLLMLTLIGPEAVSAPR